MLPSEDNVKKLKASNKAVRQGGRQNFRKSADAKYIESEYEDEEASSLEEDYDTEQGGIDAKVRKLGRSPDTSPFKGKRRRQKDKNHSIDESILERSITGDSMDDEES